MKKYESYKITKNIWYSKIPSHWAVCKVKHIANPYAGGTPSTVKPDYWENGKIPWLPSGKLQNREIISAEKFITELGLNKSSTKWIKPNTVLIALTGATCANIGYLTFRACANQSVVAIDENNAKSYSRYLYYMFLSMRKQILTHQTGGAQAGINNEEVRNLYLLTPSLQEQTQIAKYLDHKTQIIDALIDKKEQLIKKLQAQRQAIINEAVTKGLNKNVPLKDSGIEWLGKIPEHWSFPNISFVAKNNRYSITGGPFGSDLKQDEYTDKGVRIIQLQNIGVGEFRNDYKIYTSEEKADELLSCNIYPGELIIAKMADPVARACIVPSFDRRYIMASDGIRFEVDENKCLTKFLEYAINSKYLNFQAELKSTGTTRLRIGLTEFKKFKLLLPDLKEQLQILSFIEGKGIKINKSVKLLKSQIKKLKAFRQSIISEAVTGKIDVRDWQATKK